MTVKLTVNQLLMAVTTISTILRERRPMPQRGKFAFARMHSDLLPDWKSYNEQRDELIKSYDFHPLVPGRPTAESPMPDMVYSTEFAVPEDKMADFEMAWNVIGESEVELDVKPISTKLFDLGNMTDGSIEGAEIIDMGNLISE